MGLPLHFVYLHNIDPTIVVNLKYATSDNFVGRPIKGYDDNIAIMTIQTAVQLAKIQAKLKPLNLGLKLFDSYRPQDACDDFYAWGSDVSDIKNKAKYYPTFDNKLDLFNGFIGRLSQHSRGSTVDLTIISLEDHTELDMGSIFDFFGEASYTNNPNIALKAYQNRRLLVSIMEEHGFTNYHKEWWHYTLIDEPYPRKPEDHFNFPVKFFG